MWLFFLGIAAGAVALYFTGTKETKAAVKADVKSLPRRLFRKAVPK